MRSREESTVHSLHTKTPTIIQHTKVYHYPLASGVSISPFQIVRLSLEEIPSFRFPTPSQSLAMDFLSLLFRSQEVPQTVEGLPAAVFRVYQVQPESDYPVVPR